MKKILLLGMLFALGGCTKAIIQTPAAKNIRLVTASQKRHCEFVKTISANQPIGPDKTGDALKLALNQAGEAGANAFYVISSKQEGGLKGGTVVGEALRCRP
jgi:hypothetical protein